MAKQYSIDEYSPTWQAITAHATKRRESLLHDLIYKKFETLAQVEDVRARIKELDDLLNLNDEPQPRASL